jgi:hypothetical protein
MTGLLITLAIAGALIGVLIYIMGSKDHYETMTEEEFEEESKKKTPVGAAMVGLEVALRRREAEQVMEAASRIERDATPSPGDPPDDPSAEGSPENQRRS